MKFGLIHLAEKKKKNIASTTGALSLAGIPSMTQGDAAAICPVTALTQEKFFPAFGQWKIRTGF